MNAYIKYRNKHHHLSFLCFCFYIAGRIQSIRYSIVYGDKLDDITDIGFSNPDHRWHAKRKLAHKSLKQFGDGMMRVQDLSLQFVNVLLDKFRQKEQEPFDPSEDVHCAIAGMIYTMVCIICSFSLCV